MLPCFEVWKPQSLGSCDSGTPATKMILANGSELGALRAIQTETTVAAAALVLALALVRRRCDVV